MFRPRNRLDGLRVEDDTGGVAENLFGADSALLVIDVQRGLFSKPTPIYRAEEMLANIGSLVEHARAAGALVVYIQHSSNRQLQLGSDDWQLHSALTPADGDLVIGKTHGNAFEETSLHADLAARGVRRLVVTGLVTHGCVRATVQGGLALGYDVALASDAHSSYSKDARRLLEDWNHQLQNAGAQVVPTAELVH